MNYYDENAKEFFDKTVNADMSSHYEEFLKLIPENGDILDAGCGSGRDTKAFKLQGFNVTAIDGSMEMCKLASEYASHEVLHMKFQDLNFENKFDGIWALASLLHVPHDEIDLVLSKLKDSLKENGILYASFKYGNFEGFRNGRFFNDYTKTRAVKLFKKNCFKILKIWITDDSRPEKDEKWVNILVRKY